MIYLVTNQLSTYDSERFIHISIDEAIIILNEYDELGLDTETEGLDCYSKKLLLLQLGTEEFQVLFDIKSFGGKLPPKLFNFLHNSRKLFILQNAKFDLKFLFHQGVLITNVYDTMLAEIILTNGLQYTGRDLATIVEKYCNAYLDKSVRGEIITKGLSDNVLVYGARDVMYLPRVKKQQLKMAESLNLTRAIELDNSFVIVLAYVEYFGIKIDVKKWGERTEENIAKALKLREGLNEFLWNDGKFKHFSGMADLWTGKQDCILSWDSPKQVLALFKEYGIKTEIKKGGDTKQSIDAKVLEPQKKDFPILIPYLKYKEAQQAVSTFGYNWFRYISTSTGRVHTTFKQLMDTGRLSCGNKDDGTPNLQNIPNEPKTRECFIPEEGCEMIDADYSGQETIVMVNASKESNLIDFYSKGLDDMHSYVAFLMYKDIRPCTLEELSPDTLKYIKNTHPDKRQIAKAAGFAIKPFI